MTNDYTKVPILIVGAGPAGLSAAITLKTKSPNLDVVVIEKAMDPGNHNLSGAVLDPAALARLLDPVDPNWKESDDAKKVLISTIDKDDVLFFLGQKYSFNIHFAIMLAKKFGLAFGQMAHGGDYICSVSKLTLWLTKIAVSLGVEVLCGFTAEDILWDEQTHLATGVKLVDQGLDKEGKPEQGYLAGEIIEAETVLIAEGCDGLLAERFIEKAGLKRHSTQLYSIGVKELIKVSDAQYTKFTESRVVHAMGYPIWTPLLGPGMFGGGIMYPMGDNHIAVGMIVGLDFKYHDFNPQDALTRFKEHAFVKPFIEGGTVTEAGAKMIPEGGLNAIPRCPETKTVGRSNVMLLGDSAGLVNMCKIKGLHNAIDSGIAAAEAISGHLDAPQGLARIYTRHLEQAGVMKDMESAKNFRQTVAKFGNLIGMPLSVLGGWLPTFKIEPDFETMKKTACKSKPSVHFDKDTFTAVAATEHREEQPCHLLIGDETICTETCLGKFGAPCITFCPAGVYENIQGQPKPANPSNCLHCKTCQRKCPYDNIRWVAPEPNGGPRYKTM